MSDFMGVLVESVGYNNGWEYVIERSESRLVLGSARHGSRVVITPGSHVHSWAVEFSKGISTTDLLQSLPSSLAVQGHLEVWSLELLETLLRRAYDLAVAQPSNPLAEYESAVAAIVNTDPTIRGTEREAVVRQRVGQDLYRTRLLHYWDYCCAISGCDIPELLRASHAKPWVDCESDAERLDVFNGFLLRVDYDALFDTGLISFTDSGQLLVSPRLSSAQRREIGLDQPRALRRISANHMPYLAWHRGKYGY